MTSKNGSYDNAIQVFHRSIGQYDSVPDRVASLFAQCALNLCVQPVPVVRVDALEHGFATRNALRRIKPPDAVNLLRPIEDRGLVEGRHTDVSQPLCFRQIGLTAAQPIFGLLAFLDVNRQAIPLGTRLPSFRKYSFSYGCNFPVDFRSARTRSSRSRHSAGARSVQRT
jgi:hypothetical protein